MKNKHILVSIIVLLIAGGVIFVHSFNQVQEVQENASRSLNTEFTVPQMQNRAFDEDEDIFKVGIYGNSTSYISSFGSPFAQADYKSPEDFTATFTSATTLTLASLGITITDDSQLAYVRVVPASGAAAIYVNGVNGVTLREAANVVTISGAGTAPFVTGDVYEVGINNQKKAYDATNDLVKVQEQSTVWDRRTDVVTVLAAKQDFTAAWVDVGTEQDTRGYKAACGWFQLNIDDTLNARVKFLAKHTSAGSEEYHLPIKTVGASSVALESEYYEWNVDADTLTVLCVGLDNAIPYLQIQMSAGTAGVDPGDFTKVYLTKGY